MPNPTRVKELMETNLATISPDSTLCEAAQKMQQLECGVLPVGDETRPEGIITDRDIVLRAVARGKDVNRERVRDYMTTGVRTCHENSTLEEAAEKMRQYQVNRLLIEDDNGQVCGILTFGKMMREDDSKQEIANVVECAVGKKAA